MNNLEIHITDHISAGSYNVSKSLGFVKMPENYALMLNADMTHFYWLNSKGYESGLDWDKWRVYRHAKRDSQEFLND